MRVTVLGIILFAILFFGLAGVIMVAWVGCRITLSSFTQSTFQHQNSLL